MEIVPWWTERMVSCKVNSKKSCQYIDNEESLGIELGYATKWLQESKVELSLGFL